LNIIYVKSEAKRKAIKHLQIIYIAEIQKIHSRKNLLNHVISWSTGRVN